MTEQLDLKFISNVAVDYTRFDLFTDDQLNIYLDRNQLGDTEQPIVVRQVNVNRHGELETIAAVRVEDVVKIIPKKLLLIALQDFPKKATIIPPQPECIFIADKIPTNIYIYRSRDLNLIGLNRIFALLPNTVTRADFVCAACKEEIFFDGEFYFCDLRRIDSILDRLGDATYDLRSRLAGEVFMEFPCSGCQGNINAGYFRAFNSPLGDLTIYKGDGFAENAFFVVDDDIEFLLTDDSDVNLEDAFSDALNEVGYVVTGAKIFLRLDDSPKLIHKFLSLLWNGKNQSNKIIQRGWQLFDWFKEEFLPEFFKDNVQYMAYTHPRYFTYPQSTDLPDLNPAQFSDAYNQLVKAADNLKHVLVRTDERD